MKQLTIIIRPAFYHKTKAALTENRFYAMNTKEVLGRGREGVLFTSGNGAPGTGGAEGHGSDFVAKRMLEMVVQDGEVQKVIDIVLSVNRTGASGDGKIYVVPVEESVRIHTGERSVDALI